MRAVNFSAPLSNSPQSITICSTPGPFMIKRLVVCLSLLCAIPLIAQSTPEACANISLGANASLNGFIPSPTDAWHQDISQSPVDANSTTIVNTVNDLGGAYLHPDFSSVAGGNFGIPYNVVDSSQTPSVPINVNIYAGDSDLSVIPMPTTPVTEGGLATGCSTPDGDHHAIVIDRKGCVIYELWQASSCNSGWNASSGAMWDMLGAEKRPWTYTSVDAAGLSLFAGLIRYDEIVAGQITHAIRFTAKKTKSDGHLGYFTLPATHASGNLSTTHNIMGMRIRLRADFDISGYSQTNQIILRAMKQYGMILADNGSNLYFQGAPDTRWVDSDLHKLAAIPSTAFEVVQMGTIYEAATVPTGAAPKINSFTASSTNVASGADVTLTPDVTGASYSYIDKVGLIRGAVTVNPTATTTYLLTSRNAYGTTSASVTVTVGSGNTTTPTLTFASVGYKTYGSAPFPVSATSASPGAITYSVTSGPATVSGNTVTLTGVGNITLKATQAASGTYNAATATNTFVAATGNPGLAFVAVGAKTYPSSAFTVSTTTQSGGSISYSVTSGPATISGNTVTLTGAGTVVLTAKQAATGNYAAATATTSFTVTSSGTTPTLTFAAIGGKTYGDAAFAIGATSASPGAVTYSVTSGPATVAGNTVTITGAGTVTLKATQAASGTYNATTATTSFAVAAANPALTFAAVGAKTYPSSAFTVSATTKSTGAISYSVTSGPATISGNTVTLTGTGTVALTATQVAAGNYTAGSATTSFAVTAAAGSGKPTLVIPALLSWTYGAGAFSAASTSNSPGAITYALISGPATISGSSVTPTGVGVVKVLISQAASGSYTATSGTMVVTIKPQSAQLAITPFPSPVVGSAPVALQATSLSGAAVTFSIYYGTGTLSGNIFTPDRTGTFYLKATIPASGTYDAGVAYYTFNVNAQTASK